MALPMDGFFRFYDSFSENGGLGQMIVERLPACGQYEVRAEEYDKQDIAQFKEKILLQDQGQNHGQVMGVLEEIPLPELMRQGFRSALICDLQSQEHLAGRGGDDGFKHPVEEIEGEYGQGQPCVLKQGLHGIYKGHGIKIGLIHVGRDLARQTHDVEDDRHQDQINEKSPQSWQNADSVLGFGVWVHRHGA